MPDRRNDPAAPVLLYCSKRRRELAETIVNTARTPLLALNADLRVESANRSFYTVFRVDPHDTEGVGLYELGNHQWNIPHLKELLEKILQERTIIEDFRVEHDFEKIGRRVMLVNARQLEREKGQVEMLLLSLEDITNIKNF